MPPVSTVEYRRLMEDLGSKDKDLQDGAFQGLIQATNTPVRWGYEVWDELVRTLSEGDNRQRAIAAQVLCNLAKSDPDSRMLKDLVALIEVTRDERFVTARHCLQSLWKVGVVGEPQRKAVVKGLAGRFKECISEKNCTLIRYDILEALRRVYDTVKDEEIRETSVALMATEEDPKYRKKYTTVWRKS